ncbi:MAG: phage terminase small subunit P27 family [Streptosporangiales bacterium]|nr:phage terminase small subunit P27 family [Streptosporangiales bacterium]
MGRRGPAPKPTPLRILHGDKPSRINRAEPKPRDLAPVKPPWLSKYASEEWDRVIPDLEAMRTVKAVDASGLAAYCEAVARLRTTTDIVTRTGPLLIGRDGIARKNPAVAQARDASNEVRVWAREFGLTPSARSPLKIEHTVNETGASRLLTS